MDRLIALFFSASIFFIPFEHWIGSLGVVPFSIVWVGIFITTFLIAIRLFIRPKIRKVATGLYILVSFVSCVCLSAFLSSFDLSIERAINYVLILVFTIVMLSVGREKGAPFFLLAFSGATLILCTVTIYEGLSGNFTESNRIYPLGINPNWASFNILIGFYFGILWFHIAHKNSGVKYTWFLLVSTVLTLIALMLLGSRSGMLIYLIGISWLLLAMPVKVHHRFAAKWIILIGSFIFILFVVFDSNLTFLVRMQEVYILVVSGDFSGRGEIWVDGLNMWQKTGRFFMGIGPGNFENYLDQYYGYSKSAHSVWLVILVEVGLVGLLSFTLLFLWSYFVIRSIKVKPVKTLLSVITISTMLFMLVAKVDLLKVLYIVVFLPWIVVVSSGFVLGPRYYEANH